MAAEVLGSETVDYVSLSGQQVRRVSRGPGGAEVVEQMADRYRRVRVEQVRDGGLATQRVTPLSSGSGVPPAGAGRVVVESFYGQARAARG